MIQPDDSGPPRRPFNPLPVLLYLALALVLAHAFGAVIDWVFHE